MLVKCCLMSSDVSWQGQVVTNAEAWFNKSLCPQKPEGSSGRTAQDVHLDSHTAPELWVNQWLMYGLYIPMHLPTLQSLLSGTFYRCWFDDCFYTAPFSALKQTHCARMWFYMSESLFIVRFWISTKVVCLQRWHGWCHIKLLPSRHILFTPYKHHINSCKATYVRCMCI